MIKSIKGFTTYPLDYYVYLHRRLDTMEVFYVGKGCRNRAWDLNSRAKSKNSHWKNVAKKHGVYVEIVLDGLQEWYALELEAELIAQYGRYDLSLGALTNKTDGGERGKIINSEEQKIHHRKTRVKMGKPVVINNEVCMLTIRDAARYLLPPGYSAQDLATASVGISDCVNKHTKSYRNNIIHFVHENYGDVASLTNAHIKPKATDQDLLQAHKDYLSRNKTIFEICAEFQMCKKYLMSIFGGKHRKWLGLSLPIDHVNTKFDNLRIIEDMSILDKSEIMDKYSISKTTYHRLKARSKLLNNSSLNTNYLED